MTMPQTVTVSLFTAFSILIVWRDAYRPGPNTADCPVSVVMGTCSLITATFGWLDCTRLRRMR
jgi:hypothetical protein